MPPEFVLLITLCITWLMSYTSSRNIDALKSTLSVCVDFWVMQSLGIENVKSLGSVISVSWILSLL